MTLTDRQQKTRSAIAHAHYLADDAFRQARKAADAAALAEEAYLAMKEAIPADGEWEDFPDQLLADLVSEIEDLKAQLAAATTALNVARFKLRDFA